MLDGVEDATGYAYIAPELPSTHQPVWSGPR